MRCWLQSWFPLSHDVCDSTLHSDFTLCLWLPLPAAFTRSSLLIYILLWLRQFCFAALRGFFLWLCTAACGRGQSGDAADARARVDVCRGDFSCRNHFSTRWKQFRWAVAAVASCCFLWGNMFLWLQTLRGHLALYQSKLIHSLILWISFEMIFM